MIKTFVCFFLFLSCSTVHFVSNNNASVSFDMQDRSEREITIQVQKKFYMWGMVPKTHRIELDEIFKNKGYDAVSDLRIEEIKTVNKALWMVGTFGMFYPQTYKVVARTVD